LKKTSKQSFHDFVRKKYLRQQDADYFKKKLEENELSAKEIEKKSENEGEVLCLKRWGTSSLACEICDSIAKVYCLRDGREKSEDQIPKIMLIKEAIHKRRNDLYERQHRRDE
jgi:hypothetical protein